MGRFFEKIHVLEDWNKWNYKTISSVTCYITWWVHSRRSMCCQPFVKYIVDHAMMIEENWIVWGGSTVGKDTRCIVGKKSSKFEIPEAKHHVDLHSNNNDI